MAGGLVARAGVLTDAGTLHLVVDLAARFPASVEIRVRDAAVVPGEDVRAVLGQVVPPVVQRADVVVGRRPVVDDRPALRRVAADLHGERELRLVRQERAGVRIHVPPEGVVADVERLVAVDARDAELEVIGRRARVREERVEQDDAVVRKDHGVGVAGELQPRRHLAVDVGGGRVLVRGVGAAGDEGKCDEGH